MLNLIFDITLLGHGIKDVRFQTGLYRFAEEIIKALTHRSDINLYFTASQLNFDDCYFYLKLNFPHLTNKLIKPNPFTKSNFLTSILLKLLKVLIKTFQLLSIKVLLLNRIHRHFGFFLDILRIKYQIFDEKLLQSFDIYFTPYNALPSQLRNSSIKKAIYIHDIIPILFPEHFQFKVKYYFKKLIHSFSSSDIIICNSNCTKNDLLNYRNDLDMKNISVVYPGISEDFKFTEDNWKFDEIFSKYNIPCGVKYIFTLSSLNPRKNFEHVIKSYIKLVNDYKIKDLYLVIGGPKGWNYQKIFQFDQSVKHKIIFTGFISDNDLPFIYHNALIFTLMSLYEGFGFTILEAMKCGVPVITSNNSSLIEIVKDAAICLDPTNENDLAQAFYELYSSPSRRLELIEIGQAHANKFKWETCVDQIINRFKQ